MPAAQALLMFAVTMGASLGQSKPHALENFAPFILHTGMDSSFMLFVPSTVTARIASVREAKEKSSPEKFY